MDCGESITHPSISFTSSQSICPSRKREWREFSGLSNASLWCGRMPAMKRQTLSEAERKTDWQQINRKQIVCSHQYRGGCRIVERRGTFISRPAGCHAGNHSTPRRGAALSTSSREEQQITAVHTRISWRQNSGSLNLPSK